MDRRDFITSMLAGGILGTSAWSVRAGSPYPGSCRPINIVLQGDLAPAPCLGDALRRAFDSAGSACRITTLSEGDLASCRTVSALLDTAPGSGLLGVMDDASALIFQALASARGAATVATAHHRFIAGRAALCCDAVGIAPRLRWNDALPLHANRIGRLYAALLGGSLPALEPEPDARLAADAPASLASFLIIT